MASHPAVQVQVQDSATRLAWIAGRTGVKGDTYTKVSDDVWEFAELRFKEVKAAAAQIAQSCLRKSGNGSVMPLTLNVPCTNR